MPKPKKNPKTVNFDIDHDANNIHRISAGYGIVIVILVLAAGSVTNYFLTNLPDALTVADLELYPVAFIAERAWDNLKSFTDLGPRVAGSKANDELAVGIFKREIKTIQATKHVNQEVIMENQIVTGAFNFTFYGTSMTTVYRNIQNIVVKLKGKKDDALLLNCHFDTVPSSPGASDDVASCAVMLEILRVMSRMPEQNMHSIIFLFNGAEETLLQASHGFITQHKWAKDVKAFLNLESAGSGGKEVLFQTGPNSPWMIDAYAKSVRHPFAQAMAEELFHTKLIPSDTDFRIFRDYGNIPGMDLAHFLHGYRYHTKYDSLDYLSLPVLQRTGDNVLALTREIANSEHLSTSNAEPGSNTVFFDFLGLFFVKYSMRSAMLINATVALLAVLIPYLGLSAATGNRANKAIRTEALYGFASILLGALLSVTTCAAIASQMEALDKLMTWYSNTWLILGIYCAPALASHCLMQMFFNAFFKNKKEEDRNPDLETLIVEWNLSVAIYAILIQHGYSVQYLKQMDDRSLDDVFSVAKWTGHKFALRQKLVLWPESVLYQSAGTSRACQNVSAVATVPFGSTTVAFHSNPLKHRLLPTSVTSELMNDILRRNEKGKIVAKYFEIHHCLDATHRKYLAHTVVDYYIANDLYFSLPDMAKFAQLIAERFSNELPETYFNPRDVKAEKKHPSGLIYDWFHNRNKKKLIKVKSETDKENIFCGVKAAALQLSEDDITTQTTLKNWLRNNFAPAEEVQLKWKNSILLRLRSIINECDVEKSNILSEWPRFVDEGGYLLIDSDFEHLFGNCEKLFDNWELFAKKFLNYIRSSEIKDDRSQQLLKYLEESAVCQDGRDLILCYAFQALIKPTRRSGGKLPTILEAQFDVCCLCEANEEYTDDLKSLRRDCEGAKIQMTPRIYAIGCLENIEAFYVVTGKFEYKLPSFLRCLDVIVKLKHVLDYRFPESCEAFWCFITRYFYGIDYKRKSKNNQLLQLLTYLEAHCKEDE